MSKSTRELEVSNRDQLDRFSIIFRLFGLTSYDDLTPELKEVFWKGYRDRDEELAREEMKPSKKRLGKNGKAGE